MDGILTSATTLSQSGPGSNGIEGVLQTCLISITGASSLDTVKFYTQVFSFWGDDLLYYRVY